jgi:metal-responsive CopG/Arc/MetJ family transcriptional regulator
MKTAISIPDRIFRAAERAAKRQKVSRSRFYAQAVDAYLKAQSRKRITEALNAVYATEDSSLNPEMARIQSLSIGRVQPIC